MPISWESMSPSGLPLASTLAESAEGTKAIRRVVRGGPDAAGALVAAGLAAGVAASAAGLGVSVGFAAGAAVGLGAAAGAHARPTIRDEISATSSAGRAPKGWLT